MRELRQHFEALFGMLLQSPDAKGLIDALLFQVRERGAGCIALDHPCVGATEIRDRCIKPNMALVSDVWYPILDVASPDYLIQNGIWG